MHGARLHALGRDPPLFALQVELGPLGHQTTKDLIVAATESHPLRTDQVETLASRAQGSPLFLIELLEALQRSDDVDALPDSVEAAAQTMRSYRRLILGEGD